MNKPTEITIDPSSLEYAPTAGIKPLREAVALLYNDLYRKGKESQYTWENVRCKLDNRYIPLDDIKSPYSVFLVGVYCAWWPSWIDPCGFRDR